MKRMAFLVPLLLLLATTGCGGRTATISGKVTYKGRAVTSGMIVVLSPDGLATVKGTIQPDGRYSVEGVMRGRVKIGVLSPDPTPALKTKQTSWFPLPRSLGNPGTSGLECDLTTSYLQHDIEAK